MALGPRARLKPYNPHSSGLPSQPFMADARMSQFRIIKAVAEAEGWGVLYFDQGIGHDSHTFIHRLRKEVLEVYYRSSRPRKAVWNGDVVDVGCVTDILQGRTAGIGQEVADSA